MSKIGLIPLYLEMYDETCSYMRPRIENFLARAISELRVLGYTVIDTPICRVANEVQDAITILEQQDVVAILTIHLAYSPSLESAELLAKTSLPLIVLDTTESFSFGDDAYSADIMFNHGIHGVQDMCNLLVRKNKKFEIIAGHFDDINFTHRIDSACKGAVLSAVIKSSKVGLVGEPFVGMGDFAVPFDELKTSLGISVVPYDYTWGAQAIQSVTDQQLYEEYVLDTAMFEIDKLLPDNVYRQSSKMSLAIRRWVEENQLNAFTINFQSASYLNAGLPIMPFTECSKSMCSGIGYSGEGDVLTAAFIGCLLQVYPETTFTEMFCPSWEHGIIFLSHMGEFNYLVSNGKPLLTEKDFPFTDASNPTVGYGSYKPGKATLVDLAPIDSGNYRVIASVGTVELPSMKSLYDSVNGWFKPRCMVSLLEQFSKSGGTHHLALVYGDCIETLQYFSNFMGFDFVEIA